MTSLTSSGRGTNLVRIRAIFLALFLCLFISAQSQKKDTVVTLSGNISGMADGIEVKLVNANSNAELVKGKAKAGKFTLTSSLKEPELYYLHIGSLQAQYIYLEPGKISVSGNVGAINRLSVSGSTAHNDFLVFQQIFNPLISRLQNLVGLINPEPEGTKRDSLMKIYYGIHDTVQKEIDAYVTHRKNSYVTPFILFVTNQFNDDPLLVEKRYNQLTPVIKNSIIGKNLAQYIAYNKVGAVGTPALDFSQPDTSGAMVSLSSFRGKYVLVDFWASWCGPCRHENPNVVANYNKFKDKNFTVFGVSLDRPGQKEKWMEAIKADKLNWTHVSDLQFWNNAAAQLYHISSIPQNFLIDPNGKIIAKNLRGPDLENKLCELIGCN